MNRKIIFHGEYFIDSYKTLDIKVKSKFQYVFELIEQVEMVPKKFLTPLTGYEGLFEIRRRAGFSSTQYISHWAVRG